jgi:5-methylcytosine-specific restriction endonuclease McrA
MLSTKEKNMVNSEGVQSVPKSKRVNYRKLAFEKYPSVCAHCGFGIKDVLEVAHIDCSRANNAVSNLIILCPNCHTRQPELY